MERDLGPNPLSVEQARREVPYVEYMADSIAVSEHGIGDSSIPPIQSSHYQRAMERLDDMHDLVDDISFNKVINAFNDKYELIGQKVGQNAADQYRKASIEYSVLYEKQAQADLTSISKALRAAYKELINDGYTLGADEKGIAKDLLDSATKSIFFRFMNNLHLQESVMISCDGPVLEAFAGHMDVLDVAIEYSEVEQFGIALYHIAKLKQSVSDLLT